MNAITDQPELKFHKNIDLADEFMKGNNKIFIVDVPEFIEIADPSMISWLKSAVDVLEIGIPDHTNYIMVDQHHYAAFYFGHRSTFGKYLNLGGRKYSLGDLDFILFDFRRPSYEEIMDMFF